jgi:hypothetical protein
MNKSDFKVGRHFFGKTVSPWLHPDGHHVHEVTRFEGVITSVNDKGGVEWDVIRGIEVVDANPVHNPNSECRVTGGGWNINVRMPEVHFI